MQDVHDPRAFTIVERFEKESVRLSLILGSQLSALFSFYFYFVNMRLGERGMEMEIELDCI